MKISKIAEIDATNKNISKVIVFDQSMTDRDYNLLYNEFGYDRDKINASTKLYKNVGMVMNLVRADEEDLDNWKVFIEKYFPKVDGSSKFDNVFINKGYNKILLITNRRLVTVDLKRLNEKLKYINYNIGYYNKSVESETIVEPEKKGFVGLLKGMFR